MRTARFLAVLLLVVATCAAQIGYLEVRRPATVRGEANASSEILLRPEIGSYLDLLEDEKTNGYYRVRIPGQSGGGWIFKTLVRRWAGAVPGGPTPVAADAGAIDLFWWNIRNLSTTSRTDGELAQIASVLRSAEVVAIGELNDTQVLGRLATTMGPTWRHTASPKNGRTPDTAEHYGFLWNGAVLDIVGAVQVDTAAAATIDREPAWCTFRTNDGHLDFTVIAIHVTWGSTAAGRQEEIRLLPDTWNRVQTATTVDDDLILVGDFNRNVGDVSFDGLLSVAGVVRAEENPPSTHISGTSTYDQVFLDPGRTTEWSGGMQVHRFDEELFADDDAAASLACSDHRPVSIRLRLSGGDDDP